MTTTAETDQRAQSRREQRSARREAILAAARRVFAEHGFEGTTVADVARAAGVASGTVYLYFPSKTDLFAALHAQLFAELDRALREAKAPPDVRGGTRARIHAVFEACVENHDLLRLVFLNFDPRSQVARRMKRADADRLRPLAELLEQGMKADAVRQGDAMLFARVIVALVSVGIYQCFVIGDGSQVAEYEDIVTDMVIGALTPR